MSDVVPVRDRRLAKAVVRLYELNEPQPLISEFGSIEKQVWDALIAKAPYPTEKVHLAATGRWWREQLKRQSKSDAPST